MRATKDVDVAAQRILIELSNLRSGRLSMVLGQRLGTVVVLHRTRDTNNDEWTVNVCRECAKHWPCPTYLQATGDADRDRP